MALRPSQHAAPSRLSTGVAHWQKTVGGGAFKEGALRGPAQPPSSHANTQRQGATCGVLESKGTFWVQNVPFESKTKTPRFESYPGNRTKNRTSNRGAHAQECCTQCSTTCLSRRMPNAPCPYTLSILPSSKMRRALLAVGSETGDRAREQVQIRRRSSQHLAEASALGGPMKDRL